ncbi:replication initiator [Aeromicrobium sp.]|uniref:replication initiator n=1 Tax=Aeromicrobium sp. TaxID=1871063 RepID=UPI003D6C5125
MSIRSRAVVYDTLPALLPDMIPGMRSTLDVPALTGRAAEQVTGMLGSDDLDPFSEALSRVGNCSNPVKLVGRSETVDTATGEIVSTYSSEDEPRGVTYVRCGNRRASHCPSCSRVYAADMFHLIRAGVVGGKTVPESVAENPLVFATVTAPSFGIVHGRRDHGRRCHPVTRGSSTCSHGRPRTCQIAHTDEDELLGQPLCRGCYDYASHVVWQYRAPDLWRRFTITLRRLVAKQLGVPATRLDEVATVQYAKVAEYQRRGAIHFHALVRLDGPKTPEGFAPAPARVDADQLAHLIQQAAASVQLTVDGVDTDDLARVLAFGRQIDARVVRTSRRTDDPERELNPEQVAGYLAKYATKSADDTGTTDSPHHRRIRATVRALDARADKSGEYALLGNWVHMLGFRGHFATKSRRYAITLGAIRRSRRRAQAKLAEANAEGRPIDLAAMEADLLADDDAETTLVIGNWQYAGTGWNNEGECVLAVAAAARAREYAQERAQERKERHTRHLGEETS